MEKQVEDVSGNRKRNGNPMELIMTSFRIAERAKELEEKIEPEKMNFHEMVEEVRESLPPTRYTRTAYMRACQGLGVF